MRMKTGNAVIESKARAAMAHLLDVGSNILRCTHTCQPRFVAYFVWTQTSRTLQAITEQLVPLLNFPTCCTAVHIGIDHLAEISIVTLRCKIERAERTPGNGEWHQFLEMDLNFLHFFLQCVMTMRCSQRPT